MWDLLLYKGLVSGFSANRRETRPQSVRVGRSIILMINHCVRSRGVNVRFFQRNSALNWSELSRCSVRMLTSPCRWMTLNGVLFCHPPNTASASYAMWKKMFSVWLHKCNQLSGSIPNVCETFLLVAPTPTPLKNVVPRLIWITLSNETIQNHSNINRIRAQGFKHFAVQI